MVVVWRSLSFAVAAVLAAPAAFAADLPAVKPLSPPPPVTVNWTGLYGGGEIGGVYNTARYNRPFTAGFSDTSIGNIDPRPVYSLYGGFNLQVLPWAVLGVEYSHTWLRDATFREFGAAFDNLYDARRIEALTGRIGFLAKPDTMIYAKGGGARISVRYFPPFSTTLAQQTLDGVQVGGGIESLVLPNVAVRGEVTYTRADQLVLNQGFDRYRPEFVMFN